MKYDFCIQQCDNGFYLELVENDKYEYSTDKYICEVLDIDLNEYQDYLQDKFNGFKTQVSSIREEVYFKTKKDATQAKIWAESILIVNKLRGE